MCRGDGRGEREGGEGLGRGVAGDVPCDIGVRLEVTALAFLITDLHAAEADAIVARAADIARIGRARDASVVFGVRDHDAPARARLELARRLVAAAREHGARVVVHDRIDLALAADADGVWLGERSIDARDARALLRAGAFVGRSCHDQVGLERAFLEGVDAATLSPVLPSPGKGAALGIDAFAALRARHPSLPVLALGGIDAASVPALRDAGASGIAAIRAWLREDGVRSVDEMLAAFVG